MTSPIIVLNGASSSGKSSIAAELVQQLPGRVRAVSYDRPQTMVASSPLAGLRLAATLARAVAGDARTALGYVGPATAFSAARALADDGITTVVDVVLTRPQAAAMMSDLLGPTKLLVAVRCTLEELRRREETRPTRRGLAARQFETVHAHVSYDVEVHTDLDSPEECATKIIAALPRC